MFCKFKSLFIVDVNVIPRILYLVVGIALSKSNLVKVQVSSDNILYFQTRVKVTYFY